MISAIISSNFIRSNSTEALSLFQKSGIGEKKAGLVEYNPTEALFLLESGKMQLFSAGKSISYESALKKIKKHDKNVEQKVIVFKDLHKKGYIIKEGLKFGGDFRVYKQTEDHARWIACIISDKDKIDWKDFAAKNRVAHSTNKKVLFALIDREGDISYYEVSWIKP